MTFQIVSSNYEPDLGMWLQFGWVACDTCGTRVPEQGVGEVGEFASLEIFDGWTTWPNRYGPYHMCGTCRTSFNDALREEAAQIHSARTTDQ